MSSSICDVSSNFIRVQRIYSTPGELQLMAWQQNARHGCSDQALVGSSSAGDNEPLRLQTGVDMPAK
jgi:hypothetical protein